MTYICGVAFMRKILGCLKATASTRMHFQTAHILLDIKKKKNSYKMHSAECFNLPIAKHFFIFIYIS